MPQLFISHSSKDDLAAEAIRVHLVERGWNRKEIFLDFSVDGIAAHEKWKISLAEANSSANALLCLASPDWLTSKESQVERRVAETLAQLDPQRSRAVLVAILRDLKLEQLRAEGFGENQIVDLSAAGNAMLIRAERSGRHDDVKFNAQALEKIERSLRLIGIASGSFEWRPRDETRPSPYPGLEAFSENDAGVFFGRESRLVDALGNIDSLRRADGSRILTIMAASGVGKSSFLRAGLWPRLVRQSVVAPLAILRPGAGIISAREGGLIYALSDWFRRARRSVAPGDVRAHFAGCSIREGLAAVLKEVSHAAGEGRTLILAIDQAEELFDNSAEAIEAREFFDALLAVLATPPASLNLLVILTIRADAYDSMAAALARASDAAERSEAANRSALKETSLTLPPLPMTAYGDIIRRPAQVARKTEVDVFEPALVEYLLNHFTGADALPLLAKTLEQLYAEYEPRQHITRADYDALYGAGAGAEAPVEWALKEAYRMAGSAGTEETLKRLLIPGLSTWDPAAGAAGAARRRIATRASLLEKDPDLTRLADALASPKIRLLTLGRGEAGTTLEVAHEALLRVQPVKRWIEDFSVELRLRDEIEREASEWQNAESQLAARPPQPQGAKQFEAVQKRVDAAIAARRGPRLEAAMELVGNPAFARLLGGKERAYLDACQANETVQIAKQDRIVGRAFVKPALQAVDDGLSEHALRLAAAGALLANDLNLKLIPELWKPAARAIYESITHAVLKGHTESVRFATFSSDGIHVVTASSDMTARLWDVETGREIAVLRAHAGAVRCAAFSPDGTRVVTASDDKTARLWDAQTGRETALLKAHAGAVQCAVFSPDGTRVVTASDDQTARLWDAQTGREIAPLKAHAGAVQCAVFSPDGTRVVTASDDQTARLWDALTGEEIGVLRTHTGPVRSAAFSADGARVVTASDDQTARLWDAHTGTEGKVLRNHTGVLRSAVFSVDGTRVVTASDDRTARIWDAQTGREIALLKAHARAVQCAAFSLDGTRVVTASDDQTARLWDAQTGREIALLKAHASAVQRAAFSPDGTRVVTASDDKTARLWDTHTRREIAVLQTGTGAMKSAAFSPDGTRVVTASDDKTARLWDAQTGRETALLKAHAGAVQCAAFSPDGTRVVTASDDQTARLWDAQTGRETGVLRTHTGVVTSAAFSPDGARVVTASDDKTARLWDAQTGREIAVLQTGTGAVKSAVFSPDGTRVVTASDDQTARLWDAQTGREIAPLKAHAGAVQCAVFSPDGTRVVTASDDQTARLWDALTGEEIGVLRTHTGPVRSAAFSPDGTRVVTASDDQTARLWDAQTGRETGVLRTHTGVVTSAAFSPDGMRVATSSDDQTARLWDTQMGEEIAVLQAHAGPVRSASFSPDGMRIATVSDDQTARLWDISRSEAIVRGRALVLTAALSQGIGWRAEYERRDVLMQDAPDDMFSAAWTVLRDRSANFAETVAALHARLHAHCYLSLTEFEGKFRLAEGRGGRALGGLRRLREVLGEPVSVQERLDKIVVLIAANMVAEVCSVYVLRIDNALELCATEGLNRDAVHRTVLSAHEGLVGLVASEATTLNLSAAQSHPAFSYRPETGEDKYHSFLGVPILRAGNTLGVLVVQNRAKRTYVEEEVEALQTTAMVLAELIASGELSELTQPGAEPAARHSLHKTGAILSDGIALGHVVLHEPRVVVTNYIAEDLPKEIKRLDSALTKLRADLDRMLERGDVAEGGEHRDVLEAYRMFANDPGWSHRLHEGVATGLTAEAAVERVQSDTRARMLRTTDPYLRDRLHDLEDIGHRLMRQLVGQDHAPSREQLPDNAILIARAMGPAALLDYDRKRLRGLVLEEGTANSHVSIVARALGIPAVGDVPNAPGIADPGDAIIVDGTSGEIYVRPSAEIESAYAERVRFGARRQAQYLALRDRPCMTKDGQPVELMINAGLAIDLPHIDDTGSAGIGLFRTELQFMVGQSLPRTSDQLALYRAVLDAAGPKPVTFRTLDIGGDKALPYMETVIEENPALGWRAIRLGLDRPGLLRGQIRALLRAGRGRALRIMFPMISEVAEFDSAKAIVERELTNLRKHGHTLPERIDVGTMVEVPALLYQLDELLKKVDFVSVGSNDLFQFLFAVDRGNAKVAERFDQLSIPMLRALKEIADACQAHGKPVTFCGEMASKPIGALALIALGYRSLSLSATAYGPVKEMILALDVKKAETLMMSLLDAPSGSISTRHELMKLAESEGLPL